MISYILSPQHIHVVFESGKSATVYKSQPVYNALVDAVKNNNDELAFSIAFPAETIEASVATICQHITNKVSVSNGIIYLNNEPMHGTLVDRMLTMSNEGFDIKPMALFMEHVYQNPSFRAVNELYGFLESSNLPITSDGYFLAYKRVSSDFTDMYSNTMDNSPGTTVEVARNTVNEDKHNTCSQGLHFCAHSYLQFYGRTAGSRVVIVKIHPKDVVSIPADYQNAKGRCCKYYVLCEIDTNPDTHMPTEDAVIDNETVMTANPEAIQQLVENDGVREVINTYDSINDAADITGIKAAYIRRVCQGERKSTGGFGWRWAPIKPVSQTSPIDCDDAYQQELDEIADFQWD